MTILVISYSSDPYDPAISYCEDIIRSKNILSPILINHSVSVEFNDNRCISHYKYRFPLQVKVLKMTYHAPIITHHKMSYYITTAINYTNGSPHVGHAYEVILADILARYHRLRGDNVFFMTGADEHGQKVANTAASKGLTPQQLCDLCVEQFINLNRKLHISYDYYIRTTSSHHHEICQWLWKQCLKEGDIYYSQYTGWYCTREERFVSEHEAATTNYTDPLSETPYEKKSENCYFFKLSKYKNWIYQYISEHPDFIQPAEFRNEILSRLINNELSDLCISRPNLTWGIPVPDDDTQVMYVWFDALTNYITGVNYIYYEKDIKHKIWPPDCHLIGKDIIWFHAVIWPCMLKSANLDLPKCIACHGFINDKNGYKMSKSLGNIIDVFQLISEYGSDCLRYSLISETEFGGDVKLSEEQIIRTYNSDLCGKWGNLISRVFSGYKKWKNSTVRALETADKLFDIAELNGKVSELYNQFKISKVLEVILFEVEVLNDYFTKSEVWKCDGDKQDEILYHSLAGIYICAHYLLPIIPSAMNSFFETSKLGIKKLHELTWNIIPEGTKLPDMTILFPRYGDNRFKKKNNTVK